MADGIARRGITTGTPVPRTEQETSGSRPCISYQASPEMLEYYRSLPMPGRKRTSPSVTARIKSSDQKQREESSMAIELTKEQYLDKRRSGMNRNQIAQELGYKNSGSLYVQLSRWGLKDPGDEERAIRELRGEPVESGDKPVDVAPALAETDKRVEPEYRCICGNPCDGPGVACSEECAVEVQGRLAPPVTDEVSATTDDKPSRRLERTVKVTMMLDEVIATECVKLLIDDVHQTAIEHGWHENQVALPIQLALIHSEVSEALEADRKHMGEDKVAEELADVVIRVMDTAAAHNLDLAGALLNKMTANREREWRHGGRKY